MTLDVLALHDAGEALSPPERALLLAAHAPGAPPVTGEPVGRTNARLLRLYEQLAGGLIEGTVTCSGCAAIVEFAAPTARLLAAEETIEHKPPALVDGEATLTWRPVSYDDLVATTAVDTDRAVAELLARCVEGTDMAIATAHRARLSAAMAEADPLAEIELALVCPDCGAGVRADLDVPGFTWAQVRARAETLLAEIDTLARVYSWSQAEILALSPTRRARFVELATGGV